MDNKIIDSQNSYILLLIKIIETELNEKNNLQRKIVLYQKYILFCVIFFIIINCFIYYNCVTKTKKI